MGDFKKTTLLYFVDFLFQFFRPEMVKGPKTDTCVEVPAGSQYRVRVRAKPVGHIYSGYWSDWSDVLKGETPSDAGKPQQREKNNDENKIK